MMVVDKLDLLVHSDASTNGVLMSQKIYKGEGDFFSLSESSEDAAGKPFRAGV